MRDHLRSFWFDRGGAKDQRDTPVGLNVFYGTISGRDDPLVSGQIL